MILEKKSKPSKPLISYRTHLVNGIKQISSPHLIEKGGIITCEIIHGSLYKSIIDFDNINENRW